MTPALIETKTIVCSTCRQTANALASKCEHCCAPLMSPETVRVLGAAMTFIGGGLLAGMLWLTAVMHRIIEQTGNPGSKHSFNGTPEQATLMFVSFGAIAVFGLALLVTGIWHLKTGKRNPKLTIVTIGIGLTLWFLARIIVFIFE